MMYGNNLLFGKHFDNIVMHETEKISVILSFISKILVGNSN